jgi:hypothetical protein
VAVDPNVSSRPVGGFAEVTGPVESTQASLVIDTKLVPVVPEPTPGALSLTSGATASIRQGETGYQQFQLRNTGDSDSPEVRLSATVPEGSLPAAQPLQVRQGPNQGWTAVPADVSGRNVTARVDLAALGGGASLDVRVFLQNTETDWSEGSRTGGVMRASGGSESLAETTFLFTALLGDGKVVAQCTNSGTAQVRMRLTEMSNGYYKVTIEQARVTSSLNLRSPDAEIGLQLRTDGYEGAWATKSIRRGEWVPGGPTAYAYVKKPKVLTGLLDVRFDDHPSAWSPTCQSSVTFFKN